MISSLVQSSFREDGDHFCRQILEKLPIAAYALDAEGHISFFNAAAAALWGREPVLGKDSWCGSWKLSGTDGAALAHDQCPAAQAFRAGKSQSGALAVVLREDGSKRPCVANVELLRDDRGTVIGGLVVLGEQSHGNHNEDAASRLAAIVESSGDAIISKNLDGIIQSWNKGAEKLFGYKAEEIVGKSVNTLIPDERTEEEKDILRRIRNGEIVDHIETVRRRRDGSVVEISLTVSPVRNAQGLITGASKIARDISDRKREEKANELLMQEIRHRVRNTVGVAQALASQTLRSATTAERNAFISRLHMLSSAHDLLMREKATQVSFRKIVDRAISPFIKEGDTSIRVEGPDAQLDWSKATQLALILHELATNAIKFGALSSEAGHVDLKWDWMPEYNSPRRLKFVWTEIGGPTVAPAEKRGFGCKLIERAFDADVEQTRLIFEPAGVVCTLEISI